MDYRREIDGLRALAVLPVILFHAGFQTFSGGFVGVDIFFVISGYLITSIILAEMEAGTFTLANFYERRARRILPALFVLMALCLPFAWLWLLPQDMKSFSQSLVAVSAFASNVLFWRTSGYFDTAAELKPLLHTWSLAVEEQYYLLFPLFVLLTWRFGKTWILKSLFAVFIISLAAAHWGSTNHPTLTFYLLPTRGWELLIGGFIAFYFSLGHKQLSHKWLNELGSLIGVALIVYSIFSFDSQTPFPSLYTLFPTVGAALIIFFTTPQTSTGKLLSSQLFVGVGLISYSAYLYHQPLLAFAKHRSIDEPSSLLIGLMVATTFLLAYFSWRFVEAPFRNKQRINQKMLFTFCILASFSFVLIGLSGHFSKGFTNRYPKLLELSEFELPSINNGWCFYSIDTIKNLSFGEEGLQCLLGDKKSSIKGLLFGDSFAGQYEPLWDAAGKHTSLSINSITTNWCYPSDTNEFTGPVSSPAYSQCLFNRNYFKKNIEKYDFIIFGGDWHNVFLQNKFAGVLSLIDYAATNSKVVVVMPSPKLFDKNPLDGYKKSIVYNTKFDITKINQKEDLTALIAHNLLREHSLKYSNIIFVERNSIFSFNSVPSDSTTEGIPFSLDGGHISIHGSKAASNTFLTSTEYSKFTQFLH